MSLDFLQCDNIYHFDCANAAGGLLVTSDLNLVCPEHIDIFAKNCGEEADSLACRECGELGNV